MAVAFPPTRNEPFFEELPEIDGQRSNDPANWKITVRWSNYLDRLGTAINEIDSVTGDIEDTGIETQIQQVQSFSAVLNTRIDELDAQIPDVSRYDAIIAKQNDIIAEQADIGLQIGLLNARMAKIQNQLNELDQLTEVIHGD